MMRTVKTAVLAGRKFGEDPFPIIRSLMHMDGMVLKGSSDGLNHFIEAVSRRIFKYS